MITRPRGVFFIDLDGTLVGPNVPMGARPPRSMETPRGTSAVSLGPPPASAEASGACSTAPAAPAAPLGGPSLPSSTHGVHERVWGPLDALRRAGWRLAVCTGRPGSGKAMDIARRLDPDGLHVFESGAAVLDTTGRVLMHRPLPALAVERLSARAILRGLALEGYVSDGRYLVPAALDTIGGTPAPADLIRGHEALLGLAAERLEPWPPSLPLVRLMWVLEAARWPALREAEADLLALVSAHEGGSPLMPGIAFVSMTAPGVSKATGMRAVLDAYGLGPEAAAMAGDNRNDLDGLRLVARRFVAADGAPEALALADHVIPGPADGGVAEAAELLLGRVAG